MNLRVQHEDGRHETLVLEGTIRIETGTYLDRVLTDDVEHFFTKDGYYDGWGPAAPPKRSRPPGSVR